MERIAWEDLPEELTAAIAERTGPILEAHTATAGQNSPVAATVVTATGRTFVKGLPSDDRRSASQAREAAAAPLVRELSPQLLWQFEEAGWNVLGYEHIDGRHADFRPGSPDVDMMLPLLTTLGEIDVVYPGPFKRAEDRWKSYVHDRDTLAIFGGTTLQHTDWLPHNVLITPERAYLIDWAWPTLGAPWMDPAYWLIRLIASGHAVADAEKYVAQIPAFAEADPDHLDLFATVNVQMWNDIEQQSEGHISSWMRGVVDGARAWAAHRSSRTSSPWRPTATRTDDHSAHLRHALVAQIEAKSQITDPAILEAMRRVPREEFVPSFFLRRNDSYRLLRKEIDEQDWLAEVYQDQALTTQLDGGLHADAVDPGRSEWRGLPTCSASEPSLVARMLDMLSIQPGARVLEIGTGTGYGAALLCELTGAENVFGIEYDPVIAAKANEHLKATGYEPTISVGDGALGNAAAAPFDAILTTCSFPAIQPAWLEQLAPGGVAVVNLMTGIPTGILAVLTLNAPGDANGRIVPQRAWFMPTRTKPIYRALALSEAEAAAQEVERTTKLRWTDVASADGLYVLTALLLDAHLLVSFTDDGERYGLYTDDGSVALEQDGRIEQSGARRLWDELEEIARQWAVLGQPGRDEYELSIAFADGRAWPVVVHPSSGWSASAAGVTFR